MLEDINKTLSAVHVFIYSPTIESGVDITVPVKKVYGVLCCKSNSQRAYLQMLARCRNVEDGRMDIMNASELRINKNHCFWKHKEVLELNKTTVAPGFNFAITGSTLRLTDNIDTRRKNRSVFNQVEKLNKHPSLFINYLRVLATQKGTGFMIDQEGNKEEVKTKEPRTNYSLQAILQAKDIDGDEYERLTRRKKAGKTTTEENFQMERCFWQRYLLQKDLNPELLVEFLYDNNPLKSYLSLTDIRNHEKEDNLRSAKFIERSETVMKLLRGLGFSSAADWCRKIDREILVKNWQENINGNSFLLRASG